MILEGLDYRVIYAADGKAAGEYFLEYRDEIGLVSPDMVMPRINRPECYGKINALSPETPFYFVQVFPGVVQ